MPENTMHLPLPVASRPLPGRAPWLLRRLAWLVGSGLLLCLLGLVMNAAEARPSAAEAAGGQLMAVHAGAAVTVATSGSEQALPVCALSPAHELCVDAESGDPTDPDILSDFSQTMPALYPPQGDGAHRPLAQAALQPLRRPPRRQG